MNPGLVVISVALAASLLAGCDRGKDAEARQSTVVVNVQPPPQVPAKTPESAKTPPVQGQVDSREPAQRRDFQTK